MGINHLTGGHTRLNLHLACIRTRLHNLTGVHINRLKMHLACIRTKLYNLKTNVLSPRDLVFRSDIGHKHYHHLVFIMKSRPSSPLMYIQSRVHTPGVSKRDPEVSS